MVDQGRSGFCVSKFAISNHTTLKLGTQALRGCLKLTGEYELDILPNAKFRAAKVHGKDYMSVRPPLVHQLLRNCLIPAPPEFFSP